MSVAVLRSRVVDRAPRLWALWAASRPSQLALIVLVYALGVGMATAGSPTVAGDGTAASGGVHTAASGGVHTAASGGVHTAAFASRVLVGALALLPVSVAIHYANEYADADADALAERTPFSGGSGALAVTGLPASFLRRATSAALVVSATVIAGLVAAPDLPPVAALDLPTDAVVLLAAILLLGLAYSLPPTALVRRGVGEVVNAALGGVLLPLYGIAVVATPTVTAALAVVPFALVVGCNLLATHWPDRDADAAVGKRTLAVRWSTGRIRRTYLALAGTAGAVTAGLWWSGAYPDAVALAHLAPLPFLVWGWAALTRRRSPLSSVLAMVALAVASTVAWWWVGIGP